MLLSLPRNGANLIDPRRTMLVAGLFVAMGLLAGYVEVQQEAERALALRGGPPKTVAVQDFEAARDIAAAGEVSVLAELDLDRALVLSLRGAEPPRYAVIAPMFDVSTAGSVRLPEGAGVPGPASIDPKLASGYAFLALPAAPKGAITAEAFGLTELGPGAFGSVVHLNGEAIDAGAFQLMADGAFAAQGLQLPPDFVTIAPYAQGREVALMAREVTLSHRVLYLCALVVALVGVAGSRRGCRGRLAVHASPASPPDGPTDTTPRRHPVFDPIPSQTSLHAAPEPPRRTSRLHGVLPRSTRVRNRPLRPGDEAL